MKTVAIISEYNPFHTGHEYQIRKIRDEFGEETRIVAIMSGNYTQRGDVAFIDKSTRAECAIRCGANLVLEIPFPYSSSSAEFFASSGVKIADSIGVVDVLSFGSELGDIDTLKTIAKNTSSDEYKNALAEIIESGKSEGYPRACEKAYTTLFGKENASTISSPNNILALEYIKAICALNANLTPHTIKREGADYASEEIASDMHQSASAIRKAMIENFESAIDYLPHQIKDTVLSTFENNKSPCDAERISSAIISFFRLNPTAPIDEIHDAGGGLYNRLYGASLEANTLSGLISLSDTKKYTTARIKRAIWYSFFGVTSSIMKELPRYTQVLAADIVGRRILKEAKKKSSFPIITKPSVYDFCDEDAIRQKKLSDKADSIFQLTKPSFESGSKALKTSPYIVK